MSTDCNICEFNKPNYWLQPYIKQLQVQLQVKVVA